MPFYRVTTFQQFNGQPSAGFSESWEYNAGSDQEAVNIVSSLPKERAAMMSHDWSVVGMRVARLANVVIGEECKIIARLVNIPICIIPQRGLIQSDADTPWAAILIDINTKQATPSVGSTPRPRRWQLRGIPDSWWQGVLQIPVSENDKIVQFCRYITTQVFFGKVKANTGCSALGIQLYTACCVKRISNRRIGRPFGLLAGRRKATSASGSEA